MAVRELAHELSCTVACSRFVWDEAKISEDADRSEEQEDETDAGCRVDDA
jgi:hypothetical protein